MPIRTLLTAVTLALVSPLAIAKSELETLRTRCAEQERQIKELEEENSKLRQMNGLNSKYATRPVTATAAAQPGAASAPVAETATHSPKATGTATYTVKKGDSWERIARKFGTREDKLADLNGTKSTAMLREGQRIKVPSSAAQEAPAPQTAQTPAPAAKTGIYQVKQGETYYSIGKKLGIPPEKLEAANPTIKATALRPGLDIKLGATAGTPAAISTQPASATKTPPATSVSAPAPTKAPAHATTATRPTPATSTQQPPRSSPKPIMINETISVGEFAAKHNTTVARLNSLNNLDLVESTVLAVGSELYVPAQP
ncbi:MAG: LysM peptidoglycan-binding domain-containing protein [Verrucomicrobia bacterium]|nr:LysM peptidoglycan-binding domain-containing protein [Verrucomicrobiota bacterium]